MMKWNTIIRAGWQENVEQKPTQKNSKSTHTDCDSQAVSDDDETGAGEEKNKDNDSWRQEFNIR